MFNRTFLNRTYFNRTSGLKYAKATFFGAGTIIFSPKVIIMAPETTFTGAGAFSARPVGDNFLLLSGSGTFEAAGTILSCSRVTFSGSGTFEAAATLVDLKTLSYLGPVEPGDIIIIDTERKTITRNGISFLFFFSGKFFDLQPGANTIRYSDSNSSSRAASLVATYTDRYL